MRRKGLVIFVFLMICTSSFSQNEVNVGDTIYYKNNRFSYYKTQTFVIIKQINVNNHFEVDKYQFDSDLNRFILISNFTSIGLAELRSDGVYTSFFKNGKVSIQGDTFNGSREDAIWTYYYKNGNKRSEEKIYKNTILKKVKNPLIISFWDASGRQLVVGGDGAYQWTDEKNITLKGTLKDGFRDGFWIATKNSQKVYEDEYNKGKFVEGFSWDSNGEKYNYKKIYTRAFFKIGGIGIVRNYVVANFNPKISGSSGTLKISFKIGENGDIFNVQIIEPLSLFYNNEVKRIINKMEPWNPSTLRGQSTESTYSLSLHFK
jgi:hypothetical protein